MNDDYIENMISALDQLINQAQECKVSAEYLIDLRTHWYDILEQVLTGQEPEFVPF